ncbi:MAG: phosphoribosylanthranilate isomerase [Acidobacteriota bacterium]|nr:phosphoribosylanthranilate isomerase [Acidobacteriota bacterium]
MKVKVCGITSYEDAVMVLDHGVDALGFNFYPPSPRFLKPDDACAIIRRLPPFVTTVGLFVNVAEASLVAEMAKTAGVQVLQLHGDETPEYCRQLESWTLIKALRIGDGAVPGDLDAYPVQGFLLDAKDDVLFGGTGRSFDWSLAGSLQHSRPIILAGGLRPDNVKEAIRRVRPYGVDVCSGVESAPGRKDPKKIVQFMNEVRNGDDLLHRP